MRLRELAGSRVRYGYRRLTVLLKREGWQVNGYHGRIPHGAELPSPDGTYWIFYRTFNDGTQSNVYCFFVPIPSM